MMIGDDLHVGVDITALIGNSGRRILELAERLSAAERVIISGLLIEPNGFLNADASLQYLDLVQQELRAISHLLCAVSSGKNIEEVDIIIDGLRLADLAQVLRGENIYSSSKDIIIFD